jgi:hypothetical protein
MIEIFIALALFFRQFAKYLGLDYETSAFFAGNLDLFFVIAFIGLYTVTKSKPFIRWFLVIFLIGFIQFFAIQDINRGDLGIYVAKLTLCLAALFYAKAKFPKLKLSWIVVPYSVLLGVGTAVATAIGPNRLLWTVDDEVNKFDATRLMLTYIEPSELGFTIVLVLFALIYLLFKAQYRRVRLMYIVSIFINLYALYLAKPFGAIIIGVVALLVMSIYQLLHVNPTLRKQVAAIALIFFGTVTTGYMFTQDSPLRNSNDSIVQRGLSAADGEDSSINYRVGISTTVTVDSLARSPIIGQGFGILGTDEFIDRYYSIGLRTTLANSFLAFIAEAGVIGLIIVVYLICKLYMSAFRSNSYLAIGLVTFVVLYQFTGGHFSNPLIWTIYGVVFAIEDMSRRNKNRPSVVQKKALTA